MYYNAFMEIEKKTSNACKRTQSLIISTFIDLLQDRSFYDVSVHDILGAANISRTTFYRYWEDKYLLLQHIKESYLVYVRNLVTVLSSGDIPSLSTAIWDLTKQRKFFYALRNAEGEVDLKEEILSLRKNALDGKQISQNILMILATLVYTCITYISAIDFPPYKSFEQADDKTLNIFINSFSSFSSL